MDHTSKSVNENNLKTIAAIGIDKLMLNDLEKLGFSCSSYYSLFENKGEAIVICTSEIVKLHELDKLKNTFPNSHIFYLDSDMHISAFNQAALTCAQNGVELLQSRSTAASISVRLYELLGIAVEGKKNLIGFFGTSNGVGVTSVAGEFARSLSKQGLKVLMLGLNLLDPGWNEKPKTSLDQWRSKLSGRVLLESDFDECIKIDNFSYLPGNYDYISFQEYYEGDIERLLDVAHNVFDVVVADFGSHPDTAAWFVGMTSSNIRYLISKPNDRYRAEKILHVAGLLNVTPSNFLLICNKANSYSDTGLTTKLLSTELSVPLLMEISTAGDPVKQLSVNLNKGDQKKLDDHVSILANNIKGK